MIYLIKRVIAIIPGMVLLIGIIFLFKGMLPEKIVDRYLDQARLQEYSITAEREIQLRKEIRAEHGLDKPLFYLSIQSLVLPDSIDAMLEPQKSFYSALLFQYGKSHNVTQYFLMVNDLLRSENVGDRTLANALFSEVDESEIRQSLDEFGALDNRPGWVFDQMVANANSLEYLIPNVRWNGSLNQFHNWLIHVASFDFGRSISDGQLVSDRMRSALFNTLQVTIPAFIILVFLGMGCGTLLFLNNKAKRFFTPFFFLLEAMPIFWLSIMLILLFANPSFWNFFPIYGLRSSGGVFENLPLLVLPILALVLAGMGYVSIQIYKALDDESQRLYVTALKARGITKYQILFRHLLRNILVLIITIFSGFLSAAFAGSLVVEIIFSIPGMGKLLYDSVLSQDYPVILAIIFFLGVIKMVISLVSDILYQLASPQIEY